MNMQLKHQAFPTEKNLDFLWLLLIFRKSQVRLKTAGISKSGFKKVKLATLWTIRVWDTRGANNAPEVQGDALE